MARRLLDHHNNDALETTIGHINDMFAELYVGQGGGGGGDLVKISSGTISSPVSHVDIALSGNYAAYKLILDNINVDSYTSHGGTISALFSFDNQSTWLNDAIHADSYFVWVGADSCMYFNYVDIDGTLSLSADVTILPGSASGFASMLGTSMELSAGASLSIAGTVNTLATVTPTPARATDIRILSNSSCYGSAGANINKGSWSLYGVN